MVVSAFFLFLKIFFFFTIVKDIFHLQLQQNIDQVISIYSYNKILAIFSMLNNISSSLAYT